MLFENRLRTMQKKTTDAWLKRHLNPHPFHPNSQRTSKLLVANIGSIMDDDCSDKPREEVFGVQGAASCAFKIREAWRRLAAPRPADFESREAASRLHSRSQHPVGVSGSRLPQTIGLQLRRAPFRS